MIKKLKITHCVEAYYPSVGGMQEVVKQLSERLVTLGHDVTVITRFNPERNFTELNGVKIIAFNIIGNPIVPKSEEDHNYVNFLLTLNTDIITFFAAQQWATNLALPILKKINAKKVSVPTGYSGLYWNEFKTYYEDMKTYIHDYDMNVYLSDDYRDINFARQNGVSKTILIPNGAAEDEFLKSTEIDIRKSLNLKKDTFLLLHVGSFSGWKGHDELLEMYANSKIKNSALLMIGNNYEYFFKNFKRHRKRLWNLIKIKFSFGKKVVFNFFPRDFTVAAYKQSNLFVFPSNIECSPIVLFECAAAKLPFLSSDCGNSVEIAAWTRGGEIMPTQIGSDGFSHVDIAKGIILMEDMYRNKEKRLKMGETAFEIWKNKYSWEVITQNYEQVYYSLINKT